MPSRFPSRHRAARFFLTAAMLAGAASAQAQTPPAPGESARVDAIRKAGVLRVGVVNNPPWLVQNTSGSGEPWMGSSWTLGKEFAQLLGVKVVPVQVSHETKVPALIANQMDIMIGPLNENAERAKIIDFVTFSSTSVCMFGLASNPKFTSATKVEDFNQPGITMAYFSGAGEEPLVREHFSQARLRGVTNSGSVAPIEEVLAGRSDVAPLNRMLWPNISKKVKGLAVFPKENDCQDSKIFEIKAGMGVAKNQPVYLDWLRKVEARLHPELAAEERRMTQTLK
ncbi:MULTISPECIES: substrate-binding periplasmic protein [Achromobacter]|uniref:ABC transporter substrate-binding protein n=1 Tax=Achromobacter spanius TaxID=217203 RepID=A0AAW3HV24_9BURK|nr:MULTISPECIES: transporter substrate-binding domain-containing protein [Achromobacter]AZS77475.1 transporter substrate-binding domain-containing protein [Achromobacter spanius]KNE22999.1 ABC transporter substrate-binding protein [Achromobacter spanius]MCD0499046.1 transporter substrate-binding domain-containing protein [Achromobacter sp. MY14]MCW3156139.1 transporter substrate-binding domain-containing protein [Achromobacter spanius]